MVSATTNGVDRDQVQAFRLTRHHLDQRLGPRAMRQAVASCGIQETSTRTASLALHARVADVTVGKVDRALKQDKSLLMIWAMRGAPSIVPTSEVPIFTTGALPAQDSSWQTFFGGWASALSGRDLPTLVQKAADAAGQVLDGTHLSVEDLRQEVAKRMPEIRGLPRPAGAHADLPEPLFRAIGLHGVACIAEARRITDALLARTDHWLGEQPQHQDGEDARAELLRRYLRCYGPSTPQAFAEWTTRHVSEARATFTAIEPELTEVKIESSTASLLAADVDALTTPGEPEGVRLLPTQDPFLQQRDRERLLPDPQHRRRLWRPVGAPGLVLVDGQPVGTWSSRRNGKELTVTVDPFRRISNLVRQAIADEVAGIAPLRQAEHGRLTLHG